MTAIHQKTDSLDGAPFRRPEHKGFLLCGGPGCRRFTLAHSWLRRDGVFLGGGWLCSAGCLQAAVVTTLRAAAPCEPLSMPRVPRMPFRLHLLQRGALTEGELAQAQRYAKERSLALSEALLELGSVREEHLAAAHATESGCAFFALPAVAVLPCLRLPDELTRHAGAVTLHATQDRVLIGFVHRLDRILLQAVGQVFGRRAEGCFVAASRYQAQLAVDREQGSRAKLPTLVSASARAGTLATRAEAGVLVRELALREGVEWIHAGHVRVAVWFRWWRSEKAYGDLVLKLRPELDGRKGLVSETHTGTAKAVRDAGPKWEQKKLRIL